VAKAKIEQAGMKRRAAELESGRAKKAKPTASFMDYLPKGEDDSKTTAAGRSTAVSPPSKQNSVAKTTANAKAVAKAGDQTSPEPKRRKLNPKPCATDVDNKANAAATNKDTISPTAASKATSKADGQKTSESKGCELNSEPLVTNVENKANNVNTDKDTDVAAISSKEAHIDSGPSSDTKAEVVDSVAQSEAVSDADSSRELLPKPSVAASDGADVQEPTTKDTSVGTFQSKEPTSVGTSEAQTAEKPEATECVTSVAGQEREAEEDGSDPCNDSDLVGANDAQTAEKPEATESIQPVADAKRKAEDEGSNPAKKAKLELANPYNVLHNYSGACFMNATAHILHTIPKFANLRNESSEELKANNILSQEEMMSAVLSKGSDDDTIKNRKKLRDHLAEKVLCGKL
jgi:hypothetical protein